MPSTLTHRLPDPPALRREFETNWKNGRAFVPGSPTATLFEQVTLRLEDQTSGQTVDVSAEVVMVSESPPLLGTGLTFREPGAVARIAAFLESVATRGASSHVTEGSGVSPTLADEPEPPDMEPASDGPHDTEAHDTEPPVAAFDHAPEEDAAPEPGEATAHPEAAPEHDVGSDTASEDEGDGEEEEEKKASDLFLPEHRIPATVHERVRKLGMAEQIKLARTGELNERVAIERLCGKAVWDALLSNPRITTPEVARIAKMGTAPRPIIEQIVANTGWLQAAPVRRALLTNPRLSEDAALRVLRTMPKQELKLVEKQRSYTAAVRNAAKKLVRGG